MICQHVRLRRDDTHLAWGMIYAVHHSNKCPVCVCVFQSRYHGNILSLPWPSFGSSLHALPQKLTFVFIIFCVCVCVACGCRRLLFFFSRIEQKLHAAVDF